jgi:hypothetical protein
MLSPGSEGLPLAHQLTFLHRRQSERQDLLAVRSSATVLVGTRSGSQRHSSIPRRELEQATDEIQDWGSEQRTQRAS